jgi:RNA polymerase sigma-70 factor (ECF subfamily)
VELTDAQAAERAARGDAKAFMILVQRYRAPLIAFIHGRTGRRDSAEDVAQDAFCKAWEHLPGLREPAAFAGWLYQITANAIRSEGRRARLVESRTVALDHDPPDAASLSPESGSDAANPSMNCSVNIHRAIGKLAEEQRIVVSLRYFSDLSTDQIARVLGTKPGTVRSRLSRAYGELRRHLARELREMEV